MRRTEMKVIVSEALENEYGFSPKLKDIILLEASGDGTYILFQIKDSQYRFDSRRSEKNGVWVGKGTITKEK